MSVLHHTVHKKWSFPLSISSIYVTKSAVSCGFGHIYWRNLLRKTSFLEQHDIICLSHIHFGNIIINYVSIHCAKSIRIRTRITPNTYTFHAVIGMGKFKTKMNFPWFKISEHHGKCSNNIKSRIIWVFLKILFFFNLPYVKSFIASSFHSYTTNSIKQRKRSLQIVFSSFNTLT